MTRTDFQVYPAIDVFGGQCVRLLQGDYAMKTTYSDSVVSVADKWLSNGAKWLHIVDLDAAKSGDSVNNDVIRDAIRRAEQVGAKVQVGGGIRTLDTLSRWLDCGAERCVIGTQALNLQWMEQAIRMAGASRLVVGLDGRNGCVATNGWTTQTETPMVKVARDLAQIGVKWALVTDVMRDGTMTGANVGLAKEIQDESGLGTLASGGVRSVEDVFAAKQAGLSGVILGKSLYDGTVDLGIAMQAVEAC